MNILAGLPLIGSKGVAKDLQKVQKIQKMFFAATKRMEFFEVGSWKFVN